MTGRRRETPGQRTARSGRRGARDAGRRGATDDGRRATGDGREATNGRSLPPDGRRRGQTGIDFLVAMGVFLATIGFVVGFVPGMLAPFGSNQAHPVVADRTADALVGHVLGGETSPGVLNATCTVAFFDAPSASYAGCPFEAADSTAYRVGVGSRYRLNVSLREPPGGAGSSWLCSDGSDGVQSCATRGSRLAVGQRVPESRTGVTTAVRSVRVDGTDAVLVVRVW